MTVKELIERLSGLNQEAIVRVYSYGEGAMTDFEIDSWTSSTQKIDYVDLEVDFG